MLSALVLIAAAVAVGLSIGGSEPTTDEDTATSSPPGSDAPPTRQAMIGEEARDGQLVFVVEDFSCGSHQSTAATGGPSAQGKPCVLSLTVKNVSNSPAMFLARFQYLVDAQMKTYGLDEALTRARPENGNRSLSEVNLNPDIALGLVLVYDVPSSVEPLEAKFRGTGRSRFGVNVRLQRRS